METMKQLTLNDLIARAEQKKGRMKKRADVFVKSLGGVITIEEPERTLCLEALNKGEAGDQYLVYESVVSPDLKDKNLRDAYGCVDPLEIVEKLFAPGEISNLSLEIAKLAGYEEGSVKLITDLKN